MSTPRLSAAHSLNPQRPAGPRSAAGKAASPCQLPQNRPPCPIPVHRRRPPPEAKANFVQPQSAQQKIGFVPSFCPAPEATSPEPVPPALEGPELQVPESIGELWQRNPGKPQIQPLASFPQAAGVTRNGFGAFTRPGVPRRREVLLTPKGLPRNGYAPSTGPGAQAPTPMR
jgi:hypothetical protein